MLLLALIGFGLFFLLSRYAKGEISRSEITQEIVSGVSEPSVALQYLEDILSNTELLDALKEAA